MRVFQRIVVLGLVLIFTSACVGPFKREPRSVQGLAKTYVVLQGKLASAPQLKEGGKLMELYLGVGENSPPQATNLIDEVTGEIIELQPSVLSVDERFDEIKYCIAYNKEEAKRLANAAELLAESADKTVFLYAKMIEGRKFKWFYDGLDCVVYAVGVYHPRAHKYVTLDTQYGLSWSDVWSFKDAIKTLLKTGGKAAIKAVPL
ncbi:MAG: hypothetical protein V3R57_02210 [Candidatus Bathyarchaeia archaeon]